MVVMLKRVVFLDEIPSGAPDYQLQKRPIGSSLSVMSTDGVSYRWGGPSFKYTLDYSAVKDN